MAAWDTSMHFVNAPDGLTENDHPNMVVDEQADDVYLLRDTVEGEELYFDYGDGHEAKFDRKRRLEASSSAHGDEAGSRHTISRPTSANTGGGSDIND